MSGNRYLKELPSNRVSKVVTRMGAELFCLKERRKKWTTRNIEPRASLPLLIYSPYSGVYWYRVLHKDHSVSSYMRYIKDGNLYILWDDLWMDRVREEREQEGMAYRDYNRIRDLVLLREYLLTLPNQTDIGSKTRAIEIQIKEIQKKYDNERNS